MAMSTESRQYDILKGYNMLLYFAGTMIMYEPSEECILDFWTNGILKNLPVSSSNPNFIKAASQLRNSCGDKKLCREKLQEDYVRLFTRKELPLAPAFESNYTDSDNLNSGYRQTSVTEFYNSYGWQSKFKEKIKDDHLAIELLFLTRLIDKYLLLDDAACQTEMSKEIQRFIDNHLFSWIGKWNKKVQLYSNATGFDGIANLIVACSEDIYSLFDQNSPTIYSIENLKN
jgi:TorA maturation chaperone TorD